MAAWPRSVGFGILGLGLGPHSWNHGEPNGHETETLVMYT